MQIRTSNLGRAGTRMVLALFASSILAGCGSSDESSSGSSEATADAEPLVVYSGREKELVEPLYERFEEASGIELDVRYGESPAMAAQLLEEGERSPADVFYAQDAGAIGSVAQLLSELPEELVADVPEQYRASDARWVGVTGRARTLVHNTEEVDGDDLPASVLDVTDPAWKGAVGVAPTNSSFIAFISAMRMELGDEQARVFLDGLVANDARTYEKNGAIVDAVASGEVRVGLVNHYYLYEKLGQEPDAPIANHFFEAGDIGNMVNVSAAGILDGTEQRDAAEQLIAFMLDEGQAYIANEAPEQEYPLVETEDVADSERYQELRPLAEIDGPDVDLGDLGDELEPTVRMIQESGLGG